MKDINLITTIPTEITSRVSILSGLAADITSKFNDLTNIETPNTTSLFSYTNEFGEVTKIFPSFTVSPTLVPFENPVTTAFDDYVSPEAFPGFLDLYHTPTFSISGILSSIMEAISSILRAMVSAISDIVKKIIKIFSFLIEKVKSVFDWLMSVIVEINGKIHSLYRKFRQSKRESLDKGDSVLSMLWDRAIIIIKGIIEKISVKISALKESVKTFVDTLLETRKVLGEQIETLIKRVPEWSTDVACGIKVITNLV